MDYLKCLFTYTILPIVITPQHIQSKYRFRQHIEFKITSSIFVTAATKVEMNIPHKMDFKPHKCTFNMTKYAKHCVVIRIPNTHHSKMYITFGIESTPLNDATHFSTFYSGTIIYTIPAL